MTNSDEVFAKSISMGKLYFNFTWSLDGLWWLTDDQGHRHFDLLGLTIVKNDGYPSLLQIIAWRLRLCFAIRP